MNKMLSRTAIAFALVIAGSGIASSQDQLPDLTGWHEAAQQAATEMMEEYGPPAAVTDTMLIWNQTGPWKRTIIHKEAVQHDFPGPHPDVWEQFIDYQVPVDLFDELAAYDGSVVVQRTNGEISARCDKQEANFLAINLTNDIVTGAKTVEEARAFYAKTIKEFKDGGKPEYTQGLVFEVPSSGTEDPDEAAAM